ncbi:hypothetical protein P7K49_011402 [Saguinus oedipus]|uniref:Uncharacterized protein n=1 Tax=Saguinus oedipus TaxID=9490 RepID=A0ABQ9VQM2_SAGOE|nr:hypothetical protein P7K49_011402 [Saguinus oedipus]
MRRPDPKLLLPLQQLGLEIRLQPPAPEMRLGSTWLAALVRWERFCADPLPEGPFYRTPFAHASSWE